LRGGPIEQLHRSSDYWLCFSFSCGTRYNRVYGTLLFSHTNYPFFVAKTVWFAIVGSRLGQKRRSRRRGGRGRSRQGSRRSRRRHGSYRQGKRLTGHVHTHDATAVTLDTTTTSTSSSSCRKGRLVSNHGTLTSRWTPGRACSVGNNDTPIHPIHNTHVLAPTLFYLTHLRFTQVILVTKNIVNFMQLFYTTTAIRPCCVATDNRLRDPASHSRCRVRTLFRTRQLPFQ
jgi:hypothetical protein